MHSITPITSRGTYGSFAKSDSNKYKLMKTARRAEYL